VNDETLLILKKLNYVYMLLLITFKAKKLF